jgi:tight adherence protein B
VTGRTLRRVTAVVVGLTLLGLTAAVGAQSAETPFAQVRAVDALDPTATGATFIYTGSESDALKGTVTINQNAVTPAKTEKLTPKRLVANALVFDTSEAMDTSGALASAKEAARQWIRGRSNDRTFTEQFAIYAANDEGVLIQSFTADASRLLSAIDQVGPPSTDKGRTKTALWATVRQAAGALTEKSEFQPNLVIMAGQNDNVSGSSKAAATGEIASSRATVFGVAYTGNGYDGNQLKSLTSTYGGETLTVGEGPKVGPAVSSVANTVENQQYLVSYAAPLQTNQLANMRLAVGGQTVAATYTEGSVASGFQNLNPNVRLAGSTGVSFLQGGLGLALAVLLVLVAVALATYAIVLLVTRENHLSNVLQPYSEGYGGDSAMDDEDEGSYAKTAIIQRAVEMTEQFAEKRGYLARAEGALERASLPLRAGEALFFYVAVVIIATILGLALGGLFMALLLGGFAAMVPMATVSFLANRRRKKFLGQLPDTLQLLSGTLRAGYSLMQGVEAVSQEVEDPMGHELRRVVTESRLGRPLEESLDGVADRMDSPDFSWAVMAIRIQREVGGNLSELLLTVADTMTQRERLRRDVRALTAEGRMSAIVLGLLPLGLGAAMFMINPEYTNKLITDTLGNILLGVSIVSMIIGFIWMKKIIDIEI